MPLLTYVLSVAGTMPGRCLVPKLARPASSGKPMRRNVDTGQPAAYLRRHVAPSSKGKTTDSDSVN